MADLSVLHLNKRYWPHRGGIERHLRDLAAGLARQPGVSVAALVCGATPSGRRHRVDDVEVDAVPSLGTLWSLPLAPGYPGALRRRLARQRPALVHHHEPFPLGTVAWLCSGPAQRRPPLVVTWHSDVFRQRVALPLYGRLLQLLLRTAAAVIVPTERHIAASRFLPAVAERCHVIPFGVDVQRFGSPQAAAEAGALRRGWGVERVVLFVGRLVAYKGLPHLIRAMQQVDATLVIAGDGRDRVALQRLADGLGIAARIRFLGDVPEERLPALYRAGDVFVLPSSGEAEGFGIVQLEAMASGRPVISTALQTGAATVNVHGETGLIVPPGDAEALATALRRVLEHPERARAMGERGQERVLAQYRAEQMVAQTVALYEACVTNRRQ